MFAEIGIVARIIRADALRIFETDYVVAVYVTLNTIVDGLMGMLDPRIERSS